MPVHGSPLARLGFLTIGSFDPAARAGGHKGTLRVIERGEQLGFDSAWLRHRHLQPGISSPVAIIAAASQRTSRIELGTADQEDLSYDRLLRLRDLVRGVVVSASPGRRGNEEFSDIVQPHSPGLFNRLW